ncbi:hypothetical protein BDR04DRAFT_1159623 [Suillus decipiens]|nr:hypothetical protein BDR04DRAFT_1159623 [Suillus decipiens]
MSDSPEEAPPNFPQLLFHCGHCSGYTILVRNWYLWMTDDRYSDHYVVCSLDRIDYCKRTHGAKHEFLLFYFRYSTSSAEAVVYVDQLDDGSRQSSKVSPCPSSKETVASDRAVLLGSPDHAARNLRVVAGRYKKLCTLTFFPPYAPSVIQVAAILYFVHQQAPAYNSYENKGFGYADSVWMSVKKIFPQNEESCRYRNARNRYCGVGRSGLLSTTVEAVCAAYLPEWQKMMDNLKLAQGTMCSPRVLARALEEALQELAEAVIRQQAAEEQLRKAQIQLQAANEQLHKVQAEIEQLRAKIAVLGGGTTAI